MTSLQRAISAESVDQSVAGHWRIIAMPANGRAVDLSRFRGIPITIESFSFTDPFGADQMTMSFPQVSIFSRLGYGDLAWAVRGTAIDVIWVGSLPASYPFGLMIGATWTPSWSWEGYISTFNWSSDASTNTMSIQIKGCGRQLDNYLAKPEYLSRPMPYEWAMSRQFTDKPALQLSPLKVVWPSWWVRHYVPVSKAPKYMVPTGVRKNQLWSGLVTRATGSWDPVLSSYIQSLLVSMYTSRGRWTLDFLKGRQPVLFHRDRINKPNTATVVIDPILPDNSIQLSEDWEQSMTTVYGQGTSTAGVVYTGMDISADGSKTSYRPLAASRQVWPARRDNRWYDATVMPKEVSLQMQEGLNADDAAKVGQAHLQMFSEPGLTGTITIGVDPLMNGVKIPRHLVRAGMSVMVPNLFGKPNGVLFHVSASSHTMDQTTLTVDSKFRDALTVDEVRLRGKDSLTVNRMLIGGQYQPMVSDQLFPWSYAEGSGYIPSNNLHSSVRLFAGMPTGYTFPWEPWTKQRPPKSASWKSCYLHLPKKNNNASKNWIVQSSPAGSFMAVPIRMSQSGTARLMQIAAYDRDGNVMKVPFHVSFYTVNNTNAKSMPQIPAEQVSLFPPYKATQNYPFVRGGFEELKADGRKDNPQIPQPTQSVGLIKSWGNYYERAGYYPGSYAAGDKPTGLLHDESAWTWDLTSTVPFNYYDTAAKNLAQIGGGMIYMMIYCDAQNTDVYFVGRIFRAEPGMG